jgi:hypothetical protein
MLLLMKETGPLLDGAPLPYIPAQTPFGCTELRRRTKKSRRKSKPAAVSS